MSSLKLNNSINYEPINVVLTKKKTPIAYGNKMQELVEQGLYSDIESAENDNPKLEIELELYYEKHSGLFAIEADAVESFCPVFSPYTQEQLEDFTEE